jgi:hypothetical protein
MGRTSGDRRWTVEEGSDPPRGGAYVYAVREEEAYLQTDEDEKPELIEEPPDPAWHKCWFCWRTDRQRLWAAKYPVRDPKTFAVITHVFICDECIAGYAESRAQEGPQAPPVQ